MNYYTFRFIIIILISLICYIKQKYSKEVVSKKRTIILFIIMFYLIFLIPFDSFLFKFKSPKNCYNYYHPTGKIIKEYDFEDYSYILSSYRGKEFFGYYLKKNNNWYYTSQKNKITNYKECIIAMSNIKEKNIYGFYITCPFKFLNDKISIKDSINTKFDILYDKDKITGTTGFITYIGIVNNKLNNDYSINIGEYEYKPFNNKSK